MIKITDGGPKDLLPSVLKNEPKMQALSYAIERAMRLLLTFSRRTLMYAAIDEQPESILDYMAIESRAQYYDESMDIETKRAIIKNSLAWYLKAGTQESVDDLIRTVFGEGKSVPWYEFGDGSGTPGTFDIITGARMEPMMYERFARIIEKAKNKSSVLRYIAVEHTEETQWVAMVAMSAEELGIISNDIHIDDPERATFLAEYIGLSEGAQTEDKVIVGGLDTTIEDNRQIVPVCALTVASEIILVETLTEMEQAISTGMVRGATVASEQTIRSET